MCVNLYGTFLKKKCVNLFGTQVVRFTSFYIIDHARKRSTNNWIIVLYQLSLIMKLITVLYEWHSDRRR